MMKYHIIMYYVIHVDVCTTFGETTQIIVSFEQGQTSELRSHKKS